MTRIGITNLDNETLADALRGEYGTYDMSNGIRVTKAGRVVHFWGSFPKGTKALEIPKLPERFPVIFTGDYSSCCKIAEANSIILDVPQSMRGYRFTIFATILLNK